jgi:ANTAR domain
MDVIRVQAPSRAHAQRLIASLNGGFSASLNGGKDSTEVELRLDSETEAKLLLLFDALGLWLSDGGLDACQIGFGERSYTLLAAMRSELNDPTAFLLERTIQLHRALDLRIVIEQANGILAERNSISPEEAFEGMRREARNRRDGREIERDIWSTGQRKRRRQTRCRVSACQSPRSSPMRSLRRPCLSE